MMDVFPVPMSPTTRTGKNRSVRNTLNKKTTFRLAPCHSPPTNTGAVLQTRDTTSRPPMRRQHATLRRSPTSRSRFLCLLRVACLQRPSLPQRRCSKAREAPRPFLSASSFFFSPGSPLYRYSVTSLPSVICRDETSDGTPSKPKRAIRKKPALSHRRPTPWPHGNAQLSAALVCPTLLDCYAKNDSSQPCFLCREWRSLS